MTWDKNTELVAIRLHLTPEVEITLPPNYTYNLLGWWLDRIRQDNPNLSAYLHDGQSEKPFTLSPLTGLSPNSPLRLLRGNSYQWTISALYQPLCQWLALWLDKLPEKTSLFQGSLTITGAEIALLPTTYAQLWQTPIPQQRGFTLNFTSPTSFRSKKHHLPLPIPHNIFHSYLRRWNDFSAYPHNQEEFLDWVTEMVFVSSHRIATTKASAGKGGMVTGFTGWVNFGVDARSDRSSEKQQLLYALLQLAPYCGTGHKTTFGLGQTHLDQDISLVAKSSGVSGLSPTVEIVKRGETSPKKAAYLHDRLAELTAIFFQQKQRQGGSRAQNTAMIWATILVRRELGESLQAIAADLEMPYETVKTYAKLARKAANLDIATTGELPLPTRGFN